MICDFRIAICDLLCQPTAQMGRRIGRQLRERDRKSQIENRKSQILFRVRLIGRTVGSEPANGGSNPSPEANSILDFGFWVLDWSGRRRVCTFAAGNPKSEIQNPKSMRGCSQAEKGGGLQNRQSSVRIRLPAPVCFGDATNDYIVFKTSRHFENPSPIFQGECRCRLHGQST
jgi:hypothetical protein